MTPSTTWRSRPRAQASRPRPAVAKARDVLARATEKLARLQEEPDTLDIQVADAELAVARESLLAENEALEDLGAPPDPAATELLQAEVAEAAAELESALDRLRERRHMMSQGVAFVTLVVDHDGDLVADPAVTLLGLREADDPESDEEFALDVADAFDDLALSGRMKDDAVITAVRRTLKPALGTTGKPSSP